MNIENPKKISLVELMGLWSYKPVKTNGVYVLYHAPYRVGTTFPQVKEGTS